MLSKFTNTTEIKGLIRQFKSWLYNLDNSDDLSWKEEFDLLIDKKYRKYPDVLQSISKAEAEQLLKLNESNIKPESPLEKLLLAIVWKQGDYGKIENFINTLNSIELKSKSQTGLVFKQFAHHLNDPNSQPIIDQHVLRAYLAIEKGDDIQELEKIRNRGAVTQKDSDLIADYIRWYKTQDLTFKADYKLDDYLFVLGKLIKTK